MTLTAADLFATSEATWPPAKRWSLGPFTLRDGQGGGQRVSAATVEGDFDTDDLDRAVAEMRTRGQTPLFQIRSEGSPLESALEARGYAARDETLLYTLPIDKLTDMPIPRVTAFEIWEPLAIINDIWATDGIGPERLAVMARAETKTSVLARWNEKPGGAGFVGLYDKVAMVHALVVLPHQRRQGVAQWIMRRAAFWGQARGAAHISVLCVAQNDAANAFYRALGFAQVGRYHYRVAPD